MRKAKAQDCKAIPRHAVRRCITKKLLAVGPEKQNAVGKGKRYGEPKTTKRYREKTFSAP